MPARVCVYGLAWVAGSLLILSPTQAADSLVTNMTGFEIPFGSPGEAHRAESGFAVLFGSEDQGRNWRRLQTVPLFQSAFSFTAPRDGHYAFAIRRADAEGQLTVPITGAKPELEVVVDTTAPHFTLEVDDATPGHCVVRWHSADNDVSPKSLRIEADATSRGEWQELPSNGTTGEAIIPVTEGAFVQARLSVLDEAGNESHFSASHNVARTPPPATQPEQPLLQIPKNAAPSAGFGPSPFAAEGAPPVGAPAFNRLSIPPALNDQAPQQSSSRVPGPINSTPSHPSVTQSTLLPQTPRTVTSLDVVSPQPLQTPQTATRQPTPVQMISVPVSTATGLNNPPAPTPAIPEQVVKSSIFTVDYEVGDVGPSGVGQVDLYVTEDGGVNWFRYGVDEDRVSPFVVDVQTDGTYGFLLRVRNGLGFSNPPPQPGTPPEFLVTVDTAAPQVVMQPPMLRNDGSGSVDFLWEVADSRPHSSPVRLEYSSTGTGSWIPVFDWRPDPGQYRMQVSPETPSTVFFRLLVRDEAGNLTAAQTTHPVILDFQKPVARVLNVQPAQ